MIRQFAPNLTSAANWAISSLVRGRCKKSVWSIKLRGLLDCSSVLLLDIVISHPQN